MCDALAQNVLQNFVSKSGMWVGQNGMYILWKLIFDPRRSILTVLNSSNIF